MKALKFIEAQIARVLSRYGAMRPLPKSIAKRELAWPLFGTDARNMWGWAL